MGRKETTAYIAAMCCNTPWTFLAHWEGWFHDDNLGMKSLYSNINDNQPIMSLTILSADDLYSLIVTRPSLSACPPPSSGTTYDLGYFPLEYRAPTNKDCM